MGLYDLRARYYNQATGRFWARDPVEGKRCCGLSWNPYIYTRDNPINAVDPTGRGLVEDFLIRAYIFTQITVPLYLQTPQGKAAVFLGGYIAALALAERCELMELGEALVGLLETGTSVKGPPLNCNTQPEEPEP